jgi:hypothetical protein
LKFIQITALPNYAIKHKTTKAVLSQIKAFLESLRRFFLIGSSYGQSKGYFWNVNTSEKDDQWIINTNI